MEFNGQYLTYEEYKYLGGTLDQMPFNLLEYEARNLIDYRTQNRLKDTTEIPFKVKMCDYHLIGKLDSYQKTLMNSNGVVSFNTDGYSESYASPTQIKDIIASKNIELVNIIKTDLYGVIVNNEFILFDGVRK